ncbi:TPA: hypothetical protein ACPP64_001487 [Haemophilus influenzae]
MNLIRLKNEHHDDIAINVEQIRAFYPYRTSSGVFTSLVEVDVGSAQPVIVKESFIDFLNLVNKHNG